MCCRRRSLPRSLAGTVFSSTDPIDDDQDQEGGANVGHEVGGRRGGTGIALQSLILGVEAHVKVSGAPPVGDGHNHHGQCQRQRGAAVDDIGPVVPGSQQAEGTHEEEQGNDAANHDVHKDACTPEIPPHGSRLVVVPGRALLHQPAVGRNAPAAAAVPLATLEVLAAEGRLDTLPLAPEGVVGRSPNTNCQTVALQPVALRQVRVVMRDGHLVSPRGEILLDRVNMVLEVPP
mmetsp:Transcript_35/g.127  ORF Transcript_35/g.127 Transcript_35/m.127 type:complete len:233 (+) Transcript_35:914-1612(+)